LQGHVIRSVEDILNASNRTIT